MHVTTGDESLGCSNTWLGSYVVDVVIAVSLSSGLSGLLPTIPKSLT